MTATNETLTCPLCPETFEVPAPQYAPGLAAVFGISTEALASIHQSQQLHRVESAIARHIATHPVQQWMLALLEARNERDTARAALQFNSADRSAESAGGWSTQIEPAVPDG